MALGFWGATLDLSGWPEEIVERPSWGAPRLKPQ